MINKIYIYKTNIKTECLKLIKIHYNYIQFDAELLKPQKSAFDYDPRKWHMHFKNLRH